MSPRALAGPEIQRILALVPWIIAHPDAHKTEIALRFGMTVTGVRVRIHRARKKLKARFAGSRR